MSTILKPYIQLAEEICDSTEDLLFRIDQCNNEIDLTDCIDGSFDVDALYPSIDVDFSVQKYLELIFESEIFVEIDYAEVGLYLSLTLDVDTLKEEGIYEYCPTRNICGRPPTITSRGKDKTYWKRWNNWKKPDRTLDSNTKRKLLVKAFGVALKLILKNHIFTFNKKYYKQCKGGAIGVSIAGDVANLFLVWWDKELKRKMRENGIIVKLYSRYVDDGNIVVKLIDNKEGDDKEKEIMNRVKDIANSIHESIVVKVDYPSNHANKRLHVLDTEMWLENIEIDGVKKSQVLYSFYEKEMSNKYVIHWDSAISYTSKINILTNDLVRVMKNMSERLDRKEKISKVQHYVNRLQYSGYDQRERIKVYNKAKKIYNEMIRNHESGSVPLHRRKFYNMEGRAKNKKMKKSTWKGEYKSTFFVSATHIKHWQEHAKIFLRKVNSR